MQVIRRPGPGDKAVQSGCVATIGVFDGLHLGHQRILRRVRDRAAESGLPALVFTFEPTPQEYFSPEAPPARLMRFREKYTALREFGMHILYCPPFDSRMARQAPDEFIQRYLLDMLAVTHVVVGDDFRFARRRSGTLAHLENAGRRHGFGVEQVGSVQEGALRVSSTAIRAALAGGDLPLAAKLLGRPYRMAGRVARGEALGRKLGFPTANLHLHRRNSPVNGIFAVRVSLPGGAPLAGVASVGTRPTVNGVEPLLEVHIFDFAQDIYGQYLCVDFIARIRDEARFADLESLRQQMELDAARARLILASA